MLAIVVGALALFFWGFVYWAVIPPDVHGVRPMTPETEAAVMAAAADLPEKGYYYFPAWPDDMMTNKESAAAHKQKHETQPVGALIVAPQGATLMPPTMFAGGLVINVLAAAVLVYFVSISRKAGLGLGPTMLTMLMLGVFTSLIARSMDWNWMRYPTDYTIATWIDHIVGTLIAGGLIAFVLGFKRRPKPVID